MSERVDTVITGGHVLTMDAGFTEFAQGAVAIRDGRIVECGPCDDFASRYDAAETLEAHGSIVMPGLVNGHCHAAMSLFRGLAENVALDAFLEKVGAAEAAFVTPENVHAGAAVACAEMALGGMTSFVDMYWYPHQTVRAARALGMAIVTGPVFVAFPGFDDLAQWPQRLRFAREFCEEMKGEEGVYPTLAPHACYTLDEGKLTELAAMAGELDVPIQVHAAEAPSEMAQVSQMYDATPVEVLERTGLLERDCAIAHGVHLSDSDISTLARTNASVIHNPQSNAKLASGVARIADLLDAGVSVGLGTDGPSTANDLDMWKAMRMCAMLQSIATGRADAIAPREVVALATRGGAQAAGIGADTGSLEVGKRADVICVSKQGLHMRPVYDPYAALVYSAGRDDVTDVFAQGRHIVNERALESPGFDALLQQFERVATDIAGTQKGA